MPRPEHRAVRRLPVESFGGVRPMKAWLKKLLTTRVWCGPWAGMRYQDIAHGSSLLPKVVGTYELEIQPDVVDRIRRARRKIVDIGAAEGYYAVGSLFLNRTLRSVAFETSAEAREDCRELARRNGVSDRLEILGRCDVDALASALAPGDVDLLVVDVEGAETELLDPSRIPTLAHLPIVVELHDVFVPGLKEVIRRRFEPSHKVREIVARERVVDDIRAPWLRGAARWSPALAERLLAERRPPGMSWFILDPRNSRERPTPP